LKAEETMERGVWRRNGSKGPILDVYDDYDDANDDLIPLIFGLQNQLQPLIAQLSPVSCYILSNRYRYSFQHHILDLPNSVPFPYDYTPAFTPIKFHLSTS